MLIPRKKDLIQAGGERAGGVDPANLAIAGLGFLASDEDRLGDFLSLSGLSVDGLRAAAAKPEFLVAVLEHILQDESAVIAFAANENLDPALIAPALRQLQMAAGIRPALD